MIALFFGVVNKSALDIQYIIPKYHGVFMKKFLSVAGAAILAMLPLAACSQQDGLKKVIVNEVTHSIF